ncbi:uncharacterized protein DSM5745_03185 [Aspergillus mulundensis]|uniref:Uncharacterized protein n=1 Tax=Aspergillus mulundensis TaxID=1810919 RepID=A0A3D8SJR0_9EURO|nr:hypothetical protein DSM5745_03185 [Aspergillus mulundensis]RDW86543.1 hypothetical protein DSM5745_03185 [Aspergillus mulundensis]
MASAPSITALVSDPVNKQSFNDAPHQNGDIHPSKPAEDSTLIKSTDANSSETRATANGNLNEILSGHKADEPNVGEKRELEKLTTTKPGVEGVPERDSKKQKINEDAFAANAASAPAQPEKVEPSQTAPQKKKGGRPRKTKDTVKKDIPTDGIGSRTRSRTKIIV